MAGHENHEIIVYCKSGGRSVTASGILDSHGFTKVYNMLGGITAWQNAGYPVWIATVHNVNTTFNYDTIQAAIDAAQTLPGHKILAEAEIYYENIVLHKSLSLVGENPSTTIIDGSGEGSVLNVTVGNANISFFTIRNSGVDIHDSGVFVNSSNEHNINNNIVTNNSYGIYLQFSSNNTIFHNTFVNNTYQVHIDSVLDSTWDDDYPSGGNYWSDHAGQDLYRGPYQNETGSDGIVDAPYVVDVNNTDRYPLMKPYGGPYDIGITNITAPKRVVGQGHSLNLTIKIINYGITTETFDVTAYANTTAIQTITSIMLTSRNSTNVTLTWDTTGFAYGNHTLSATATPVPSETDTADNIYINGQVLVTIAGDTDGDLDVDYDDFIVLAGAYGSSFGQPAYKPEADFDNDGDVDYDDFIILAGNYGKTNP